MNDSPTQLLLDRYQAGEYSVVGELLQLHRARLKRMVRVRLHPLLKSRLDESDILQDAMISASTKIGEYLSKPPMPFFLWLRWLTDQQIKHCHRFHLDAQKRDMKKVRPGGDHSQTSLSELLVEQFASSTPSQIVMHEELHKVVSSVLESLKPKDREILSMRHFEQMTNQEIAVALDLDPSSASSRYFRALAKLQHELAKIPGFFSE